jgi:hypothetical protein
MPRFNLAIEEIDESMKRPIVHSIVTDLCNLIGLHEDLPILFKGESPQHQYNNAELNGDKLAHGNNRYSADSYITITNYTDEDNETTRLSTPVDYIDDRGIFFDNEALVYLVPVRMSKRFEINISITGSEKQIERWRAIIKKKTAQGVLNGLHAVSYHYPIPKTCMAFLIEAHDRRERVASYNESLADYFDRCFIPTMQVLVDSTGKNPEFVIAETQKPIQGWFDFGLGAPKKEKDDDSSRYMLEFSYTVYVDVPETINLLTPLIIHNQILPAHWLPLKQPMAELDFIKEHGSYSHEAFNRFRFPPMGSEYGYNITNPGLSIPPIDDWLGDEQPLSYVGVLRVLCRLDEADPYKLQDLLRLGEWKIDPLCVNYMQDTRAYLTSPYDNVMVVQPYSFDNLLQMDKLKIDENLAVRYEEELSLREMHHLVVGMCYNPKDLTDQAIHDLARHACFFKKWISMLFPWAPKKYGWNLSTCTIGSDDDVMNEDDIADIIDELVNPEHEYGYKAIWPLVGFFAVWAHRENQLDEG